MSNCLEGTNTTDDFHNEVKPFLMSQPNVKVFGWYENSKHDLFSAISLLKALIFVTIPVYDRQTDSRCCFCWQTVSKCTFYTAVWFDYLFW